MSIYETTSMFLDEQRRREYAMAWRENTEIAGPSFRDCDACEMPFNDDAGELGVSFKGNVLCEDCMDDELDESFEEFLDFLSKVR